MGLKHGTRDCKLNALIIYFQSNTWFDGYQATTQQISSSSDSEPDESFSRESSPKSSPELDNDTSMC